MRRAARFNRAAEVAHRLPAPVERDDGMLELRDRVQAVILASETGLVGPR